MSQVLLINLLIDFAAATLLGALAAFAWRSQIERRFRYVLPAVPTAGLLFVVGDVVTLGPPSLAWARFGTTLQYAGVLMAATSWAFVGLLFLAGDRRVPRWATRLMLAVSLSFLLFVATNGWHGLFVEQALGGRQGYRWGWAVMLLWVAVLIGVSVVSMLAAFRRDRSLDRSAVILIASVPVPIVAGSAWYATAQQMLPMDPAVIGWLIAPGLMLYGVNRLAIFRSRYLAEREAVALAGLGLAFTSRSGDIDWANEPASAQFGAEAGRNLPALLCGRFRLEGEVEPESTWRAKLPAAADRNTWLLLEEVEGDLAYRLSPRWIEHRGFRTRFLSLRFEELTDLLRMQREMLRRQEEARLLVEELPYGVLVCDEDGIITSVNRALLRSSTFDEKPDYESMRRQVIGQRIDDIPQFVASGADVQIRRSLEERVAVTFELEHESRFGRVMPVRCHCTPVLLPHGGAATFVLVEDLSTIVETSERLQELEVALGQNQRFQSLGTAAAAIAHDFNNLLTAIRGHLDLALLDAEQGRPIDRQYRKICESVDFAAALVREIMMFAGRTSAHRQPSRPAELVDELQELLRTLLPARVSIEVDIEDEAPAVLVDRTQIRQVLLNLSLNAADSYGDKPGKVRLEFVNGEVSHSESERVFLHMRVVDQGCGIETGDLDRLFDAGFSTKAEGRGLGLAMVKEIVQAHGGRIEVSSEVGVGTTIEVVLPGLVERRSDVA